MSAETRQPPRVAQVDQVMDENGQPIALPENSTLQVTREVEETIGGTGPTNWWKRGLIAVGIVVVILLAFQLLASNTRSPASAPAATTTQ
ncbi:MULTISPECIES: hypothetical protein [unclassified Devosia]|uniref:hypothetical protein n=1 Tax=unclassified Devosia TaxID=196773 RepID=UPI00086AB041|nr:MULTISPECIES: hypothetical protein [unclassified Devosia]MBN9360797.1 hypothetical protein [Devosia sp.]ODS88220.1 MAG: hypothetical protein ABS47_10740 [Devosia sp. SCN 66-27]OJX22753.1 MAG: hypothetical protein BGO83_18415 [Devosia sp. 66-14]